MNRSKLPRFQRDRKKNETNEVLLKNSWSKYYNERLPDLEWNVSDDSRLGRGVDGSVYPCTIFDEETGGYVALAGKFLFSKRFDNSMDKRIKRELIITEIKYHRNIVPIFRYFESVRKSDLPHNFSGRYRIEETAPLILMKRFWGDLATYIEFRKFKTKLGPLQNIEICRILQGMIHGVHFLHSNHIIHRDLHARNIFVEWTEGRIVVADFGRCLDLRKSTNRNKFIVERERAVIIDSDFTNIISQESSHSHEVSNSSTTLESTGGCVRNMAPEFHDPNAIYYDYSKYDVFSIGILAYDMIRFLVDDEYDPRISCPYGIRRNGDYSKRKQESYEELKGCDPRLSLLIKNMLPLDPKKRCGIQKAKKIIDSLTSEYEYGKLKSLLFRMKCVIFYFFVPVLTFLVIDLLFLQSLVFKNNGSRSYFSKHYRSDELYIASNEHLNSRFQFCKGESESSEQEDWYEKCFPILMSIKENLLDHFEELDELDELEYQKRKILKDDIFKIYFLLGKMRFSNFGDPFLSMTDFWMSDGIVESMSFSFVVLMLFVLY